MRTTVCARPRVDTAQLMPEAQVRMGSLVLAEVLNGGNIRSTSAEGSFSAVSKPNFARKYALEGSLRDLHNALESNPPMKRNGRKEENGKIGRTQRRTMETTRKVTLR